MPRRHRNVLLILAATVLVLVAWFGWQYIEAIESQSRKFYQTEYLEKAIKGKVKRLSFYGERKNEVVIAIDNGDEFDLTYGRTCVDEFFSKMVHEGDSVTKQKNSKTIRFFRAGGFYLETELNFCGLSDE